MKFSVELVRNYLASLEKYINVILYFNKKIKRNKSSFGSCCEKKYEFLL